MKDYPRCQCGKNPAIEKKDFDILISELCSFNKILEIEEKATCKTCKTIFNHRYKHETSSND
jgi:hypothetical protein